MKRRWFWSFVPKLLIGGNNVYMPTCRQHFKQKSAWERRLICSFTGCLCAELILCIVLQAKKRYCSNIQMVIIQPLETGVIRQPCFAVLKSISPARDHLFNLCMPTSTICFSLSRALMISGVQYRQRWYWRSRQICCSTKSLRVERQTVTVAFGVEKLKAMGRQHWRSPLSPHVDPLNPVDKNQTVDDRRRTGPEVYRMSLGQLSEIIGVKTINVFTGFYALEVLGAYEYALVKLNQDPSTSSGVVGILTNDTSSFSIVVF